MGAESRVCLWKEGIVIDGHLYSGTVFVLLGMGLYCR